MRKVLAFGFMVAALAVAASPAFADSLIVNGGFEDPDLGSSKTYSIFDSISGWTKSTGTDGLEIQANSIAGDPHGGTQLAELDSTANSGMFQDIDTVLGESYYLSFYYSPRPSQSSETNGINVYWDGDLLDAITATGGGNTIWTQYTYVVTGGGDDTRLEFLATGVSDSLGGYLDDVSLTAVPEPGTLGLLGLGLATIVVVRRRRRLAA